MWRSIGFGTFSLCKTVTNSYNYSLFETNHIAHACSIFCTTDFVFISHFKVLLKFRCISWSSGCRIGSYAWDSFKQNYYFEILPSMYFLDSQWTTKILMQVSQSHCMTNVLLAFTQCPDFALLTAMRPNRLGLCFHDLLGVVGWQVWSYWCWVIWCCLVDLLPSYKKFKTHGIYLQKIWAAG
jgi:hypothetical protein